MYCIPGDVVGTTAGCRVFLKPLRSPTRYFEIVGVRDTDEIGRLLVLDLLERVGVTVD